MSHLAFSEREVRSILDIAIEPLHKYPVCEKKLEATHASASAVAGISAVTIKNRLSALRFQVNLAAGDIHRELNFKNNSFFSWYVVVNLLHNIFARISHCSDFGFKPNDDSNGIDEFLAKLTHNSVPNIKKIFEPIQMKFNRTVDFLLDARAKIEYGSGDADIKRILLEVASRLSSIDKLLLTAITEVDSGREKMRTVWAKSIDQIKKCKLQKKTV